MNMYADKITTEWSIKEFKWVALQHHNTMQEWTNEYLLNMNDNVY